MCIIYFRCTLLRRPPSFRPKVLMGKERPCWIIWEFTGRFSCCSCRCLCLWEWNMSINWPPSSWHVSSSPFSPSTSGPWCLPSSHHISSKTIGSWSQWMKVYSLFIIGTVCVFIESACSETEPSMLMTLLIETAWKQFCFNISLRQRRKTPTSLSLLVSLFCKNVRILYPDVLYVSQYYQILLKLNLSFKRLQVWGQIDYWEYHITLHRYFSFQTNLLTFQTEEKM